MASKLGNFLQRKRDEKGMTNGDLAKAAGVDESTIGAILSGAIIRPPDRRLSNLARLLGTSLATLKALLPEDRRDAEDVVQGSAPPSRVSRNSAFLIDEFVTPIAGQPYRLFAFGKIKRGKTEREITPEYARKFKLPHYNPVIKLGSHKETTPAAGHIKALEVREDGLYAVPEWVPAGESALKEGAYRYHSPEVIWDGGLEDASTGQKTPGPIIVGDALLHNPALGEQTAFYTAVEHAEINGKEQDNMSTADTVNVPAGFLDRLLARFDRSPDPEPTPEPDNAPDAAQVEKFETLQAERDELSAKIATMEAAEAAEKRVAHYAAEIATTPQAAQEGADAILAGMTDAQADWVVTEFKALSAQIDESKLTGDVGASGDSDTHRSPQHALDAAAKKLIADSDGEVTYLGAIEQLRVQRPDLVTAYYAGAK